ncbi:MAG: hypothetical protein AAB955_01860 [Patescibacteria group bacterium]
MYNTDRDDDLDLAGNKRRSALGLDDSPQRDQPMKSEIEEE